MTTTIEVPTDGPAASPADPERGPRRIQGGLLDPAMLWTSLPDSLARWEPFPDTVAALGKLKQRCRLAIISNVDDALFAATAPKLGVEFDHVITAQQAQAYKPSLEFFKLAEERIGAPRERWLHAAQRA